jgi:hypothetical protein
VPKSFNLLGKYENKTYLAGPCINPEIPKSDSNTEFIFSFHDSLIDCACRSNILQASLTNIMNKSNFSALLPSSHRWKKLNNYSSDIMHEIWRQIQTFSGPVMNWDKRSLPNYRDFSKRSKERSMWNNASHRGGWGRWGQWLQEEIAAAAVRTRRGTPREVASIRQKAVEWVNHPDAPWWK